MLPQEPSILLSYINAKLRDEFGSLDDLCGGLDAEAAEIKEKLSAAGYAYDETANQFKPM